MEYGRRPLASRESNRPDGPLAARTAPFTTRVARWSATHPWRSIGLWFALVAGAIFLSVTVPKQEATDEQLGQGESGHAFSMIEDAGLTDPATESVLIQSKDAQSPMNSVDHAQSDAAAAMLARELRALPEVAKVDKPVWSPNGRRLLVSASLRGPPADAADKLGAVQRTTKHVAGSFDQLSIKETGSTSLDEGISSKVASDLTRAERFSLPITLLLMVLAFGALIAAAIPVLLALSAVVIAMGMFAVSTYAVPDNGSTANVILLIGMAVGVDYCLFFVRRQREERERGVGKIDAVEIAARTAGHSILVSGCAVLGSMAGLFFSHSMIFTGLGVGAMLVVAVAMLGSLTVVPALVGKFGRFVDRPRVPLLWRLTRRMRPGSVSGRIVGPVIRHPKAALLGSAIVVSALAIPAAGLSLHSSVNQLPSSIPAVATMKQIQRDFASQDSTVELVVKAPKAERARVAAAMTSFRSDAIGSGHFSRTGIEQRVSKNGTTSLLVIPTKYGSGKPEAVKAVEEARSTLAPAAFGSITDVEWAIGGDDADSVDFDHAQRSALPWVLGFVLGFTLLMMGITFRSAGIALLTLGLNLASVVMAFGVLALVFQHSWAESLLDFTSNGAVVSWIPLFLFVVLVGLSMDYHVLVLSRIREAAQRGSSPAVAVSWGLRQTAGVVGMAAVVMISVFSLFATGSIVELKEMGVGLAAAVLIDATLVRLVMLPAVLVLAPRTVEKMARRSPHAVSGHIAEDVVKAARQPELVSMVE